MTYTTDRLWEEVVYVAYYLHWTLGQILDLEHRVRNRVVEEIGSIHQQLEAGRPAADRPFYA